MFKPSPSKLNSGSILAGSFIVSVALVILLMSISTLSKSYFRQANSHLSRITLRRLAQETWRQALVHLQTNPSLQNFKPAPGDHPKGETTVRANWVQLPEFGRSLYLVITATAPNANSAAPTHLKLHTVLKFSESVPNNQENDPIIKDLQKQVENQLKNYVPENDSSFQKIRNQLVALIERQLHSASQTAEYRGGQAAPSDSAPDDTFNLALFSVDAPSNGPKILLWREEYE